VLPILLKKYWTLSRLTRASEEELATLLHPLGLYNQRAKTLKKFAEQFYKFDPKTQDLSTIHGVGQYAIDSWGIFIEGDLNVEPTDKKLKEYLRHVK
jgi:methyl-CpG-binding domain protein 4